MKSGQLNARNVSFHWYGNSGAGQDDRGCRRLRESEIVCEGDLKYRKLSGVEAVRGGSESACLWIEPPARITNGAWLVRRLCGSGVRFVN
jgi:hypothetical protein